MLKLFDQKKRWAVVTDRLHKSKQVLISRNTKDGKSFSIKGPGSMSWAIVDTEEFLLAIMHVTNTEQQLIEMKEGVKNE